MTKISSRDFAALKRNAMNVYPQIIKRDKLVAQIAALQNDLERVNAIINATETGSRIITGGVNSTDLIQRRVIDTGKVDANGMSVKTTKWEPIADRLIANEDGSYTMLVEPDAPAETEDTCSGTCVAPENLQEPVNEVEVE